MAQRQRPAGPFGAAAMRLSRFRQTVRFTFPQRSAIAVIVMLMLAVAAINAIEPLVIKSIFDGLGAHASRW